MVDADFVRVSQVLSNLIHNSAKFTNANGAIDVSLRTEGKQAILQVRDTGSGIDPALLPHVFELFTQGAHSHQEGQEGLGIGLTLSRRLVEMHGGSISAYSSGLGLGSTFTIHLPTLNVGSPEVIDPVSSALQNQTRPTKDLLIVDDNIDAASSLAALLGFFGHSVRVAHNGQEAFAAIEARVPEAVLLDIGLSNMNGHEVARRIRAMDRLEGIRLTALSGYGQEQDKQKSEQAGFDAHLTKPANLTTLQNALYRPLFQRN